MSEYRNMKIGFSAKIKDNLCQIRLVDPFSRNDGINITKDDLEDLIDGLMIMFSVMDCLEEE